MAGINGSLQSIHQQNPSLECFFTSVDPRSLILSQFSNPDKPNLLQLTTESFVMERGPRYKAYADLRESKLRIKNGSPPPVLQPDRDFNLTPPRKQVKFERNFTTPPSGRRKPSVLAQSVPDFSSASRKENRKPATPLPPVTESSVTPPAVSKSAKLYGSVGKLGASKSVNSGEKKTGGLMARKSYASLEDLKGLASASGNGINGGDGRGGRSGRGIGNKTVLGYRQC